MKYPTLQSEFARLSNGLADLIHDLEARAAEAGPVHQALLAEVRQAAMKEIAQGLGRDWGDNIYLIETGRELHPKKKKKRSDDSE